MYGASPSLVGPRVAAAAEIGRDYTARVRRRRRGQAYKSIYGKHDHTRGTVGIDAYAEAAVGHGATWWGAASGPSSARARQYPFASPPPWRAPHRAPATCGPFCAWRCDRRTYCATQAKPQGLPRWCGQSAARERRGQRGGGAAAASWAVVSSRRRRRQRCARRRAALRRGSNDS